MTKTAIEQWDETSAGNSDIDGFGISNSTQIVQLDDIQQSTMSQLAKWLGDDTLASATTTDLGSVPGRYVSITGTTTIAGFGTIKAGTIKYVKFAGVLTLTYNVTSLILPGAANITTAAGDTAILVSEGSGNWRCLAYQRAAVAPAGVQNLAKAWGYVTYSAGVPTLLSSFNCSITDTQTGQLTVTLTSPLADANYAVAMSKEVGIVGLYSQVQTKLAGSFVIQTRSPSTNNSADPLALSWVVFGA